MLRLILPVLSRPSRNESFRALLTLSLHGITTYISDRSKKDFQLYKQNMLWEELGACFSLSAFICNGN